MKTNVTSLLKKLLVLSLAIAATVPLCAMKGAAGGDVPSLKELAARSVARNNVETGQIPLACEEFIGEAGIWLAENNLQLIQAAENGHVAVVTALLAAGAAVNARDRGGYAPLHAAARRGHVAVVTALLAAGAAVNAHDRYDKTPLHVAAMYGYGKIVGALLVAGADKNIRDNQERTAAVAARVHGYEFVAQLIEQYPLASAGLPRQSSAGAEAGGAAE